MSYSRYNERKKIRNQSEIYQEVLEKRDVNHIDQYETPTFSYPTPQERSDMQVINHVWQAGDHYWKLAAKHYGDASLWWIIAQFNYAPTEAHVSVGEVIQIPASLEQILNYYKV